MVSGGNVLFTLLGFLGMYTILSLLYIFLVLRRIEHGVGDLKLVEPGLDELPDAPGESY